MREVFDAAMELDSPERPNFLAQSCEGDDEIRHEVESLLAAHVEGDHLVGRVVGEAAEKAASPLRVGTNLGPYKVIAPIGEGGMGSVYLAERSDQAFQMQVAIKVVRGGLDSVRALERFQEERRILATLDHVNIARVIDGGSTEDGLPYLVMEHVPGQTIDRYCELKYSPIRDRVLLFRKICDAVDHAHRQLIVHRDIKPANVLVTDDGVPKLLDFGIAKLLEGESAFGGLTGTGLRLMTPDYASPEQIRGEPVTTATDVHALGILLYELLTGRHPFSKKTHTPRELEAAVLDRDPDSPSTAVTQGDGEFDPVAASSTRATSPAALRKELAGDLDNIIMKALSKEPERRYPSAAELSADLGRFLEGHPVTARPSTFTYRAEKFLKRNVIGVTIAAAFFATIVTAGIVSIRAYIRADRMRVEAETQRDRLGEINSFLARTFEAASPKMRQSPEEITAREILDAGAARLETDLKDRPEIAAALQTEIGRRYYDLGLYDRAEELHRAAVAGYRSTGGLATPEGGTALTYLGGTLEAQGKLDEAATTLQEAVKLSRPFTGTDIAVNLEARQLLAKICVARGDYDNARDLYDSLLAELDRTPDLNDPDHAARLSSVPNDFGLLLERLGDYEEAERQMRHALEMAVAAHGEEHSVVGQCWANLAFILNRAGRQEEGVECARQALAIQEVALGEDHLQVAVSRLSLADALAGIGEVDEAERHYPRVLEVFRETYGENHHRIGTVLNNAAIALLNQGEPERARPKFEQAAAIYAQAFGAEHQYTAIAQHNIARALHQAGRLGEAEKSCKETLALRRRIFEGDHPDIGRSEILLGNILRDGGSPENALPHFREAVRIGRGELAPGHPVRLGAERALARCLTNLAGYDEAEQLFLGIQAVIDSTRGPDSDQAHGAAEDLASLKEMREKQN